MKTDLMMGDCLSLMGKVKDGSVDLILCDLPYGTTACKWDAQIQIEPLWTHYRRIIKRNGTILLFGSEPFSSRLRMSNIEWFKYDWIWRKNRPTGFQHAKNMPLKDYEIISVFSPGSMGHASLLGDRRMTYNPQGIEIINKECRNGKVHFGNTVGKRPGQKDKYIQTAKNYPQTTLSFTKDEKRIHPTQKPVALLEYLIKTHSNKNETVLDNCMGSGSTGVACINTGRNFVGIELDSEYFAAAERRIKEAEAGRG